MARQTRQARAAEIGEFLDRLGAAVIGETEFAELCDCFAPQTPDSIRKVLRESGRTLAALVEGVRQDSFEALERTLSALAAEYSGTSDRERRLKIRRLVIRAKDHARFAARRSKDDAKRRDKEEMAHWLLVWLENPPIFEQWVHLRRAQKR